jgi:hypothetical protein
MKLTHPLSRDQLIDSQLASDQQQLEPQLAALAAWAREQANRSEEFWLKQGAQIRARLAESELSSNTRPSAMAWATVSAVILTATILLNTAPHSNPPSSQVDPDHELLIEVEHALHSNGPEALEPAALLVQEISLADKSDSPSSQHRDRRNHEN